MLEPFQVVKKRKQTWCIEVLDHVTSEQNVFYKVTLQIWVKNKLCWWFMARNDIAEMSSKYKYLVMYSKVKLPMY